MDNVIISQTLNGQICLKGSCDNVLKKKFTENLINVPSIEKGVSLYLKVMMTFISSNTEEAICTLTQKVSTFKVTSIQGENINTAVSQLRGAGSCLMSAERFLIMLQEKLLLKTNS